MSNATLLLCFVCAFAAALTNGMFLLVGAWLMYAGRTERNPLPKLPQIRPHRGTEVEEPGITLPDLRA
jgi:hypothetical protein